jgi:hypothetical protein
MATSGLTSAMANALLAASVGEATLTAFGTTTHPSLKLLSALAGNPETTAGTEISGGSYPASGGIVWGGAATTVWGSPAYSANVSSIVNSGANGALSQTGMPAVTVVAAEYWDGASTPIRWWWGNLSSSVTTNSGDTLTFAASSITMQINT